MDILGTKEWIDKAMEAYETIPEMKELAKAVEIHMAMRLEAKPEVGLDEDINILMNIGKGAISIRFATNEQSEEAPIIAAMDYENGKAMLEGKLDMTQAFMQGKMKVVKGNVMDLGKYSAQLPMLTKSLGAIMGDTQWPDELSSADLENFKQSLKEAIAMGEIQL